MQSKPKRKRRVEQSPSDERIEEIRAYAHDEPPWEDSGTWIKENWWRKAARDLLLALDAEKAKNATWPAMYQQQNERAIEERDAAIARAEKAEARSNRWEHD
jgi:hypothetical protein